MSAEVTLEERKTLMLMKLRGYKLIERVEKKEIITFLAKKPKEDKRILIWCIPLQIAIGVRYIEQMKQDMQESNIEEGIIITGGRYTPSAKTRAPDKDIELIPRAFPAFNIFEHILIPKHEILTLKEREKVLSEYKVQPYQLPWIKTSDPAAIAIGAKPGDVLRIIRESQTAGKYISYRYVIEG